MSEKKKMSSDATYARKCGLRRQQRIACMIPIADGCAAQYLREKSPRSRRDRRWPSGEIAAMIAEIAVDGGGGPALGGISAASRRYLGGISAASRRYLGGISAHFASFSNWWQRNHPCFSASSSALRTWRK